MCSARLPIVNFGSERLRHDTRPSLRSNRRSAQQSYHGYTALRTSSMARTLRATKLVVQDNPDGKYLIKGGGPKIPRLYDETGDDCD